MKIKTNTDSNIRCSHGVQNRSGPRWAAVDGSRQRR